MHFNSVRGGRLGLALLWLAIAVGCRGSVSPDDALAQANETNIQRLANLYFTYQMKHDWQGPADESEFRQFIESYDPAKLTRIGIDPATVDELFINPRDGQPFKIRYGVPGSAMGSSAPVIFEAVGVDGQRMVGFLDMEQREVDEAEYQQLWSSEADAAPPPQSRPGDR